MKKFLVYLTCISSFSLASQQLTAAPRRQSICHKVLHYLCPCKPNLVKTAKRRVLACLSRFSDLSARPQEGMSKWWMTMKRKFIVQNAFTHLLYLAVRAGSQPMVGSLLDIAGRYEFRVDATSHLAIIQLNAFHLVLLQNNNTLLEMFLQFAAQHPRLIDLNLPLPIDFMQGRVGDRPGHLVLKTENTQGLKLLLTFAAHHPGQLDWNAWAPSALQSMEGFFIAATPLHKAVCTSDLVYLETMVQALIGYPKLMDVNARIPHDAKSASGATPFYIGLSIRNRVLQKTLEAIRLLRLCPGLDATIALYNGITPLHQIVLQGRLAVLKVLLGMMPQLVNTPDQWGATPLWYACYDNKLDMVQELLQYPTDPDQASHCGLSPMGAAVWHNNLPMVDLLLKHGACNLTVPDRHRDLGFHLKSGINSPSAFFLACYQGYTKIACRLLAHPASFVCPPLLAEDAFLPAANPLWRAFSRGHITLAASVVAAAHEQKIDLFYYNDLFLSFLTEVLDYWARAIDGQSEKQIEKVTHLALLLMHYQDSKGMGIFDWLYRGPSLIAPERPYPTRWSWNLMQRWINWVVRYNRFGLSPLVLQQTFADSAQDTGLSLPTELVAMVGTYMFPRVTLQISTKEWLKKRVLEEGKDSQHRFARFEQFCLAPSHPYQE